MTKPVDTSATLQGDTKSKSRDENGDKDPSRSWKWRDETGPRGNLREAVAVFDTEAQLQEAIDTLESHGFSGAALSRPPDPLEVIRCRAEYKADIRSVEDMEDNPHIPRRAYVDPGSRMSGIMALILIPGYILGLLGVVIASANGYSVAGIAFLSAFLGAFGALVGFLKARKIKQAFERRLAREKALGGLLLWVRIGSLEQETKAFKILKVLGARHLHVHGPVPA